MDILGVFVVFLALEIAICGVCWFVCGERHMSTDTDKQPKKMFHHSPLHPSRLTQGVDHQKTWSHASDQQLKGHDNNIHLTCFRPNILP